jgi:alpha-beta hydrolase superfamily lysophospholipase
MLDPHLFTRDGRNLFGLHFAAQGRPKDFAVVFCNAFGKEFVLARTHVSRFCRELAARGVGAYRFDYQGYGDSEGEFADATFSAMCRDLEAAVAEARRRCRVEKVVLAGVRFGALVAEAVASRSADTAGLVMWAPTLPAWDYFYDALRQTISMQTAMLGKIVLTRDQIIENVLAGQPSRADGYDLACTDEGFRLGAAMIRELQAYSPAEITRGLAARTLLVHVSKRPGAALPEAVAEHVALLRGREVSLEVDSVSESALPWVHEATYAGEAPALFDRTFRWLGA